MERLSKGVHRILVLPREGGIGPKLLTQTDVSNFLMENCERSASLGALFKKSLRQLDITGDKNIDLVSVASEDDLVLSLNRMLCFGVHAVPVVDSRGKILTVLTMSDFRG